MNKLINRNMNGRKLIKDYEKRYLLDTSDIFQIQTDYYTRVSVIDTFPLSGNRHKYAYILTGYGSIYSPLWHHFCMCCFHKQNLQAPSLFCMEYFYELISALRPKYNFEKIASIIFGSKANEEQRQFLDIHCSKLIRQNYFPQFPQYSNSAIIEFVQKNSINCDDDRIEEYMRRTKRYLMHFSGPYQEGECREYFLQKMVKELKAMYDFNLTSSTYSRIEDKYVYLVCNRFDQAPNLHENNSHNENVITLEDLVISLNLSEQQNIPIADEHEELVEKMLKNVVNELLMYEFSTGRPYPRLHIWNILYNTQHRVFSLDPSPIIIEALGFQRRLYSKKFINSYAKQFEIQKTFSLESTVERSNNHRLLLCLHYLQYKKFKFVGENSITKSQLDSPQSWIQVLNKNEDPSNTMGKKKCIQILKKSNKNSLISLIAINKQFNLNSQVSDLHNKEEYIMFVKYTAAKLFILKFKEIRNFQRVCEISCEECKQRKRMLFDVMQLYKHVSLISLFFYCNDELSKEMTKSKILAEEVKDFIYFIDFKADSYLESILLSIKCNREKILNGELLSINHRSHESYLLSMVKKCRHFYEPKIEEIDRNAAKQRVLLEMLVRITEGNVSWAHYSVCAAINSLNIEQTLEKIMKFDIVIKH